MRVALGSGDSRIKTLCGMAYCHQSSMGTNCMPKSGVWLCMHNLQKTHAKKLANAPIVILDFWQKLEGQLNGLTILAWERCHMAHVNWLKRWMILSPSVYHQVFQWKELNDIVTLSISPSFPMEGTAAEQGGFWPRVLGHRPVQLTDPQTLWNALRSTAFVGGMLPDLPP